MGYDFFVIFKIVFVGYKIDGCESGKFMVSYSNIVFFVFYVSSYRDDILIMV